MKKIENFTQKVINYRVFVIGVFTLIVLGFGYFLKDIQIEGNYRIWYAKDSTLLKNYDKFIATFGSDDGVVIAYKSESGIFNKESLRMIADITDKLSQSKFFSRVSSLTNYQNIRADDEYPDEIIIENLIDYIDELDTDSLNKIKAKAVQNIDIVNSLISKNAKTTIIFATLSPTTNHNKSDKFELRDEVLKILSPYKRDGKKFYIIGESFITTSFIDIAKFDGVLFTSLSIISIVLLLAYFFRSALGSLVPMIIVIFTFIIVLSSQVLLGYKINNFTANLPIFVIAIAIAHSVHIFWVWFQRIDDGLSSHDAIIYSINVNMLPVFLTAFTTFIGFISLGVSEIIPIKTLGIASAFASILAFILSIVLMPAILSYFNPNIHHKTSHKFLDAKAYSFFIINNDKKIIIVSAIIIAIFLVGLFRVNFDSNVIKYFKPSHDIRVAAEFITQNITGPKSYEFVIDSGVENGAYEIEFLQEVDRFSQDLLNKFKSVRNTKSVINIIKRFNEVMNANNKSFYTLPKSKELVAQYLLMYNISVPPGMNANNIIDITNRYIRVSCATDIKNTTEDIKIIEYAKRWWIDSKYSVEVNGKTIMIASMQSYVTDTLSKSISIAFVLITVVMLIVFKNFKLIFIFIIPNLIPIIAALGAMGLLNINVDMGIALSLSIILGIAVDDAIHFLTKYLKYRQNNGVRESIEYVMDHAGGAMILTTIILSLSFLFLVFSSFNPNVYFAITTISALLIALIVDLFLLPAIFSVRDTLLNDTKM